MAVKTPSPSGHFLQYDFRKLHYESHKMIDISSLALAGIVSNSWVAYVNIQLAQNDTNEMLIIFNMWRTVYPLVSLQ